MDHVKRKYQSWEEKSKKLRNELNRSIENLSNELILEIFDYLDGCVINMAFSNLNHRFQQLLNSSSVLFKITPDRSASNEILIDNYKQIIHLNRRQIFSMNIYMPLDINEIFSSFTFDSSFMALESLFLNQLEPHVLMPVLSNLSCLPRLFSLTIKMIDDLKDLSDIYRIILSLPVLKYYKFKAHSEDESTFLPMATNQKLSTIEHLIIKHSCTLYELSVILSYAPQLRRLNLIYIHGIDPNLGTILPMTLTNLKCIFLHTELVTFEQIETFISKINCKLTALDLTIAPEDITLLDADRWEQILRQYLPQLETFCLRYHAHIDDDYEPPVSYEGKNQFNSLFWIERQWIFEAKSEGRDILYSICPYRKRWYDYDTQHNITNSPIELSKSNRLIVPFISPWECDEVVIIDIKSVLNVTQFYHLELTVENIFTGLLIQIIDSFRELNSLQIITLSLYDESRELCEEELQILDSVKNTSKISKVCLGEMVDIEEVYFLMKLCPYMEYLKIDFVHNMDTESFLRDIFKKIDDDDNEYLRSLCLQVPAADDQMIKNLKEMINSEKLLVDYTIRRELENIYLQWK